MTVFGDEWDNLRAAFEWFASVGDVDAALRLVVACHWFAFFSYRFELLGWAERAISLDGAQDHELWSAAAGAAGRLALGDRRSCRRRGSRQRSPARRGGPGLAATVRARHGSRSGLCRVRADAACQ